MELFRVSRLKYEENSYSNRHGLRGPLLEQELIVGKKLFEFVFITIDRIQRYFRLKRPFIFQISKDFTSVTLTVTGI